MKCFIHFLLFFVTAVFPQFNNITELSYFHHRNTSITDSTYMIYDSTTFSYKTNIPWVWDSTMIQQLTNFICSKIDTSIQNYAIHCTCTYSEGYHLSFKMNGVSYSVNLNGGIPFDLPDSDTSCSSDTYSCAMLSIMSFISNANINSIELASPKISHSFSLLYPIPCRDELKIIFAEPIRGFSIYDISGKLFKKSTFMGNKTTLNIRYFMPGIYFIKWNVNSNNKVQRFFVLK